MLSKIQLSRRLMVASLIAATVYQIVSPPEAFSSRTRNTTSSSKLVAKSQSEQQSAAVFDESQSMENVVTVQRKRAEMSRHCAESSPETVQTHLREWFQPNRYADTSRLLASPSKPEPCRYVFLDFGANVGDSLAKFISSGTPVCPNKQVLTVQYDREKAQLEPKPRKSFNRLVKFAREQLASVSSETQSDLGPEHYCYFGVEGNPVFTERLQNFEQNVMNSEPRPVRYAHFFTETVGAGVDGPAVLYLDTINADNNFWGSSMIANHWDVAKSATGDGKLVEAHVDGLTLTTLLKQAARMEPGAHIIIKCDIEGAEYALLNEAFDSGILCEYAENAVRIDMLIEIHPAKMIGANADADRFHQTVKAELSSCGIHMTTGRNAG